MSVPIISHKPGYRFTVRVAAIIIDQHRVLLHRGEPDPYWSLPGGCVELLEPTPGALQRAFHEVTGQSLHIDRLVWVVENFLTVDGEKSQELGLYYLAHLDPTSVFPASSDPQPAGDDEPPPSGARQIFQWFPIDPTALALVDIRPAFLRSELVHLPEVTKHVINLNIRNM